MSAHPNTLALSEFRAIWVYALDVPDSVWGPLLLQTKDPQTGEINRPLADALGIGSLDFDFIDFVVEIEDQPFTLSSLLINTHGMDEGSVAPDRAKLDRVRGQVLLVHSGALGAKAPSVEPRPPLAFIGRYSEAMKMDGTPMAPAKSVIPTNLADPPRPLAKEPLPAKKKPSDAAMGGRVATIALLVMGLLVWVMIKIAG